MTYWIYDPKKLATASTLIPYKQRNVDEVLNFLTVLCLLSYVYLYKNKSLQKYGGALAACFITILFLGIIVGLPKTDKVTTSDKNENYGNYDNSLFID